MQRSTWNPLRELAEAQQHFSSFFHDILRSDSRVDTNSHTWVPAVDISENGDAYLLTVELPGMEPEAVEIEVKNNTLSLKGERLQNTLHESERVHHRERPVGRFARVFRLPKRVDADSVTATCRDGILSIRVPLRAEAKPRKIDIQG